MIVFRLGGGVGASSSFFGVETAEAVGRAPSSIAAKWHCIVRRWGKKGKSVVAGINLQKE